MSNLRELTNTELDLVSAGALMRAPAPAPTRGLGGNPVVTLIEDIIRLVEKIEGNNPGRAKLAA